jgi:uncharacterized repeat protein (TIGR04138 family)
MQDHEFSEIVAVICKEDPRYDRKAYKFVSLGLEHTVKDLRKRDAGRTDRSRHVTGRELLEGLREFALEQYGPMAKTVLNCWGVERCRDFGAIVFNLIDYNVFSKTESDRPEDFEALYDFEAAFVKPFQPISPPRGGSPTEALGQA